MHRVEKKYWSGSFEDRGIFTFLNLVMMGEGALCAHYRSIDKFVKNVPIFKTTTQKKSTQCIILLLFLSFSQIKIGGTL